MMAFDLSQATLHRGKISESDSSYDYEFWRNQHIAAKMAAIWEMTVYHHAITNRDPDELRLDRTVGGFSRKQR